MRKLLTVILAPFLLMPLVIQPSMADERGRGGDHRGGPDRGHDRGHEQRWRGDIGRFHEHDLGRWRGGHWYHGRHGGRLGWWWIVGTIWYFYPAPAYPFPDPYEPPVAVVPPPSSPVAPQYWYYCPNPPGYYPYVPQCWTDWQRVPAVPPR